MLKNLRYPNLKHLTPFVSAAFDSHFREKSLISTITTGHVTMPPIIPDQRDESQGVYSPNNVSLEFFQHAIQTYQRQKDERESRLLTIPKKDSLKNLPPKKRSPLEASLQDEAPLKPAEKKSRSKEICVEDDHHKNEDVDDIKKKRLASRVSSKRTREREKLRLDHFQNAKLRLEEDNKLLEGENTRLRDLIKNIKLGKASGPGLLVGNQSMPVLPPMQNISNSLPQHMAPQRAPVAPQQSLDLKVLQPLLAASSQQPLGFNKLLHPVLATNPSLLTALSNPLLLSAAALMGTSLQQAPSYMAGGNQRSA